MTNLNHRDFQHSFAIHRFVIAIILISVSFATAQTPLDLEKQYGKPVISYIVSEHILMTPEYAVDGQVCMMRYIRGTILRVLIMLPQIFLLKN